MHDSNIFNTIVGFIEYMAIEKRLTSINLENMELIHRRQEITQLQSELIKEKKTCDSKLEINLAQKLKLEKRKLQLLPVIEPPVPTLPKLNTDVTPQTKSPCFIRKVKRSSDSSSQPSKIRKHLFPEQMSDNDLLAACSELEK